jgi:hypothetical protein
MAQKIKRVEWDSRFYYCKLILHKCEWFLDSILIKSFSFELQDLSDVLLNENNLPREIVSGFLE